jgi:hypothetical protein
MWSGKCLYCGSERLVLWAATAICRLEAETLITLSNSLSERIAESDQDQYNFTAKTKR